MLIAVEKCKFYTKKTDFIGFIVELKQISIDLKKIKAIMNWQDLNSIIGLRSFLGFYNYYKRFIVKQLEKTELFTRIIKKNKTQKQKKEYRELFKEIKNKFTKELILKIYKLELPIKIKTDLLDFILGVQLLQKYKDKIWYLVVYYSRKLILVELNYNIYNKELLVIVAVLKEWRVFL